MALARGRAQRPGGCLEIEFLFDRAMRGQTTKSRYARGGHQRGMKSLRGHPAVSLPCARPVPVAVPVAVTDRRAPDRGVLEAAPRWDEAVESRSPEEGS